MVDAFGDWKTVTPLHNEFIGAITGSPKFVIGCMRSKMEYVITDIEKNGKKTIKVEKIGLKAEQRENAPYEFGLTFVMDSKTMAHLDKDRTNLFNGIAPFQIDESTGKKIREWSESGKVMTEREKFRLQNFQRSLLSWLPWMNKRKSRNCRMMSRRPSKKRVTKLSERWLIITAQEIGIPSP